MKGRLLLAVFLGTAGIVAVGVAVWIRTAEPGFSGILVVAGLFMLLMAVLAGKPERIEEAEHEGFIMPVFIETALLLMAVFLALAITAYIFSRAHGIGRM